MKAQANAALRQLAQAKEDLGKAYAQEIAIHQGLKRLRDYFLDRRRVALRKVTDEERTRARKAKRPKAIDFALKVGKEVFTKRSDANAAILKAMQQVLETYNRGGAIIGEYEGLPLRAKLPGYTDQVRLYLGDGNEDSFVTAVLPPKENEQYGQGRNIVASTGRRSKLKASEPALERSWRKCRRTSPALAIVDRGLPDAVEKARHAEEDIKSIEEELKREGEQKAAEKKAQARGTARTGQRQTPPMPGDTADMPDDEDDGGDDEGGGGLAAMALPGQPSGAQQFPQRPTGRPPIRNREELRAAASSRRSRMRSAARRWRSAGCASHPMRSGSSATTQGTARQHPSGALEVSRRHPCRDS